MKEHPIIFSTPMIAAIQEGRKTQTRRVMKPQPHTFLDRWVWAFKKGKLATEGYWLDHCPYGQVGDRLWVKETHYRYGRWIKNGFTKTGKQAWKFNPSSENKVFFEVCKEGKPYIIGHNRLETGYAWWKRPSIFMPRWASRITLELTEVRVERVQEITPEDIVAEGISVGGMVLAETTMLITGTSNLKDAQDVLLKCAYHELVDSINGKKYPWESNYRVWVLSFKVVNE